MTTLLQSASVKSLALRVLQEMATRRVVQGVCPNPAKHVGQDVGQDIVVREGRREGLSACGSPDCAGCYLVDPATGAMIHPPKCSEDYRAWLERWEAKGRVQ